MYADSLSPISRDGYRFSDHPELVQRFRDSIARVASLDCDILLTPHPGGSSLNERLTLGRPLLDTDGCKNYAARLAQRLDDRLAKEKAGQ